MAKINKEQQTYANGMAYALRIVQAGGIETLEKEIELRGLQNLPLNVNHRELSQIARVKAKEELMIVATAMADTMSNDMKLPPSVIVDFLRRFNKKVDEFRYDKEKLEKVQAKLNSLHTLNETIKKFNEEDSE